MYEEVKVGDIVTFDYTNYRGELAKRKIIIKGFFFGKTNYHPDYQMFIIGFCLDKMKTRDFAVGDIQDLEVINLDEN